MSGRLLTEAQTIYYGLQCLVVSRQLGPDKLFSIRTACVPVEEWTGPMWYEAARVVGTQCRHLPPSLGDPTACPLVRQMVGKPPSEQALTDACNATPRPTEEQLDEVKAMAEQHILERKGLPSKYDVDLSPDLGFARLHRHAYLEPAAHQLPGFCETDKGEREVWLCSELQEFIISHGLNPAPNVLPAIADEIARIEETVPWGLVLEKASSCADPADYPAKLIPVLRAMNLKGIRWE